MLSLFLLLLYTANTQSQCTKNTVDCVSIPGTGTGAVKTASCSSKPGYMLVSCGILIDSEAFISYGTSMTDTVCTIDYNSIPSKEGSNPIPYARCCYFTPCFHTDIECKLQINGGSTNECPDKTKNYPHLLSCGIRQRYGGSTTQNTPINVFNGILFKSKDFDESTLRSNYFKLFGLPTKNPTPNPTSKPTTNPTSKPTTKPTSKPTTKPPTAATSAPTKSKTATKPPTSPPTAPPTAATSSPTKPPTSAPTKKPTSAPTTPSPTYKPSTLPPKITDYVEGDGFFTYNQYTNNQCTTQRFEGKTNFLWLYSLCCTSLTGPTSSPTLNTVAPTNKPTSNPTLVTLAPTKDPYVDTNTYRTVTTPIYPYNFGDNNRNPLVEFDDHEYGKIEYIRWGISNTKRNYTPNDDGGIKSFNDNNGTEWFFTIKSYKTTSGTTFTSEYGTIFLSDSSKYCQDIPYKPVIDGTTGSPIKTNEIQAIHVYADNNNKILGMTMIRGTDEYFTCHIAMAENQSDEFKTSLLADFDKTKNNTIDFTNCGDGGLGLSGFYGAAPDDILGIQYIGFVFVGDVTASNIAECPNNINFEEAGVVPTTTSYPSFSPLPKLTPSPTSATSAPSKNSIPINRTLQCYYIMDQQNASCKSVSSTRNPSFMTGCIGYSLFAQPNSWYIDTNNICRVKAIGIQHIAAIATCCYLVDPSSKKEEKEFNWNIFGIVAAVVGVVAIFGVGIALYIYIGIKKKKKNQQHDFLKKSMDQQKNAEQVLILNKQQIDDRLGLKQFEITEKEHEAMLRSQISAQKIGLDP